MEHLENHAHGDRGLRDSVRCFERSRHGVFSVSHGKIRPMSRPHFSDARRYNETDLAARYRSTAGTQPAVDPEQVQSLLDEVEREGYVVVAGALSPETVANIKSTVGPLFEHDGGRNNFEGLQTRRLYAVPEKTDACDVAAEHPLALALLDRLFRPNYLLSQLQVIDIQPGEAAQPLHPDDAFYPFPRPRPPLGAATIFALDDFTEDNGATVVVPGSHRWGERSPSSEDPSLPCVMPAGSMLFFVGTLWHGGGENRSSGARMCVTAQYCEPFLRTQENYSLSVTPERLRGRSEHMLRLLGYNIHPPFMGMVDGKHPKRVLER